MSDNPMQQPRSTKSTVLVMGLACLASVAIGVIVVAKAMPSKPPPGTDRLVAHGQLPQAPQVSLPSEREEWFPTLTLAAEPAASEPNGSLTMLSVTSLMWLHWKVRGSSARLRIDRPVANEPFPHHVSVLDGSGREIAQVRFSPVTKPTESSSDWESGTLIEPHGTDFTIYLGQHLKSFAVVIDELMTRAQYDEYLASGISDPPLKLSLSRLGNAPYVSPCFWFGGKEIIVRRTQDEPRQDSSYASVTLLDQDGRALGQDFSQAAASHLGGPLGLKAIQFRYESPRGQLDTFTISSAPAQ